MAFTVTGTQGSAVSTAVGRRPPGDTRSRTHEQRTWHREGTGHAGVGQTAPGTVEWGGGPGSPRRPGS